jgi:ankyrin repeat protein
MSRLLALSLCVLTVPASLSAQSSSASPVPAKVDFATDVQPILRTHCVECHGPDKQRAGMRLDRKSSALKAFSRRIVPGSSDNSFLYHRLIGEFGQPMPPDGGLKPVQIATIKAWIDQGAEWPDALSNEVDLPAPGPKALAAVEMLRSGNRAGFMKAVSSDPLLLNARGPEGSTPFMYAVLYTDTATLAQLIRKGADVNKHNDANATALMWAARDLGKTKLLLDHGADVNAKSDDLRTSLMIAARHPGGSPIVKLLLDHGANPNPNAKPEQEGSPLLDAITASDAVSTKLLLDRGANGKAAGEMGLMMSVASNCPGCIDLIAAKITDKAVFTAALQDIAVYGDVHAVQVMLDHGADANASDFLGRTALMYAARSDASSAEVVKLLLEHGADVNAKDKHVNAGDEGWTALDMAKQNGNETVAAMLVKAGAKSGGMPREVLTPRLNNEIRAAIQDSIPLLQKADFNFVNKAGCVSCHNDSLTAMTVSLARSKGFQVDEQIASTQLKANAEALQKLRDRLHQGMMLPVIDNFSESILGYMLMGLHAEGYKPNLDTDAAAIHILSRQQPDGHWYYQNADTRPPLCLDHIGMTVKSMRSLQLYAPKANAAQYQAAIAKAAAWLATEPSYNNEDRTWRVAGLAWAGTHKDALRDAVKELLASQKPDGSWADKAEMESTAYATGKSLVVLHLAGMPASDPVYQRGVNWLLADQQKDGSWYVPTRALAFQPWFDSGFPHAHDQWISAAGSNWAAMALAYAVPSKRENMASTGSGARVRPGVHAR